MDPDSLMFYNFLVDSIRLYLVNHNFPQPGLLLTARNYQYLYRDEFVCIRRALSFSRQILYGLLTSEEGQFKQLEKTISIYISDITKPIDLVFNHGQFI